MGKKFKISFENIPEILLREIDGGNVLTLQVPSLRGRTKYCLKDGDILEAIDQVMEIALENFEFPKIPIKIRSKKVKTQNGLVAGKVKGKKKIKELAYTDAYYTESLVRGKKPFKQVIDNV